jgi:hypothetical protein
LQLFLGENEKVDQKCHHFGLLNLGLKSSQICEKSPNLVAQLVKGKRSGLFAQGLML